MNYPDDEVAAGLEQLGRSPYAKFLQQFCLDEMMRVSGPGLDHGAVKFGEGRRSFASELIGKLKFEPNAKNDGPDAAKLIRRSTVEQSAPESRRVARRAAAEE